MNSRAFMAYVRAAMPSTYIDHDDPIVEFYDDKVRITDLRGGALDLSRQPPRVLRALAQQLNMVADEQERRSFEDSFAVPACAHAAAIEARTR